MKLPTVVSLIIDEENQNENSYQLAVFSNLISLISNLL